MQIKNQIHDDYNLIHRNSFKIGDRHPEIPTLEIPHHSDCYIQPYKEKNPLHSKDDTVLSNIKTNLNQYCENSFINCHAKTYPKYRIKKFNKELNPLKLNPEAFTEEEMDYEPLDFIQSEESLCRSNSLRKNSSGSSTPHKYTDYVHLLHNILLLASFNSIGNEDDTEGNK